MIAHGIWRPRGMDKGYGIWHRLLVTAIVAICVAVPPCPMALAEDGAQAQGDEEALRFALEDDLHVETIVLACKYAMRVSDDCYAQWYQSYLASRIVRLAFPEREPLGFGPWDAREEYGTADAAEDGSLTEWAWQYFITHDWSDYGQQILTMEPQDIVTINGLTFEVEDAFDYPKDGYLEEVRDIVGEDVVVIQTCEPSSTLNRIVYGRPFA